MRKRMRIVLAPTLTMLLVLQSLMPGVWAENEQIVQNSDVPAQTEVVGEEITPEVPTTEEPTEIPTEPPTEEPTELPTELPTEEPPVVPPSPVWLGELLPEQNFKQATCDTAPTLSIDGLLYHNSITKVELLDGSENLLPGLDVSNAAGTTVWVKVTFVENHVLQADSYPGWITRDEGRTAQTPIVFAPAPTEEDCTTRVALPAPTVITDETGEAEPQVVTDHIQTVAGVESVLVQGDVVAGNDVVVRAVFAHRHALDTTVDSGWQEDANGDAIFSLTIADDDVAEKDATDDEGAPDDEDAVELNKVSLPAPDVVTDEETGEETDVNTDAIASVEGVEAVTVEETAPGGDFQVSTASASDNNEVLVRVSFDEGSEFDKENSDAGWVVEEDGSAIFALTIAGGVMPAEINPDASGITNAVISPTTLPDVLDPVRIDMDWTAVGDSLLSGGDSFTFTIENYELLGIGEITADDPIFLEGCGIGGLTCGIVVIDEAGNGTVILNENVDGAQSASGNFWIQTDPAWAEDLQEDEDTTIDFDVISNDTTYPISVTIPAAPIVPTPTPEPSPTPGTYPFKDGWFNSADNGRENPNQAITWQMRAPTGPSNGATLTDTITADAGWEFDCSTWSPVNDNGGDIEIDVQCTPTSITIVIGPYLQSNADNTPGIRIQANITDEANSTDPSDGSLTFENVVISTNQDWEGEPFGEGEDDDEITQYGPGPRPGGEANPAKSVTFTNDDEGRINPEGAIQWTVRAPVGPADGVRLVDEAEDGWVFVCDPTLFNGGNWTGGHAESATLVSCTPERVEVEFGAYREHRGGQTPYFTILATRTAEQPENERGVLTFENTVTSYLTPWGGGDEIEGSADASITQTVPPVPNTDGNKTARFTRRDNGQYNPTNALEWTITFPAGPNGRVVFTDPADTNDDGAQMWAFDCSTLTHVGGPAAAAADINCGPDLLTIEYPDGYESDTPVYTIRVNLLVPFEEGQVFENNATLQVWDYLYDPDWGEDGSNGGNANGQITQNRSQGGTGEIGEFVVSVGDYVWFDENRNGLQDDSEPGIGGVLVELYGETAPGSGQYEPIGSTTTNNDGYYWFQGLQSDRNYYLDFTQPTELPDGTPLGGWTIQGTEGNPGSEGPWVENDSNVNENGLVYFTAPTMGANQGGAGVTDNPTLDAGVVLPLVSIGDYVWFDYDRDGVQGTHELEEPVAGVTVTITGPGGFEATTTTDANGYYFFNNLEPSTTYNVIFEVPEGYDGWTVQGAGEDEGVDSNVNAQGETSVTTPASGNNLTAPGEADDPTIDAGLVRLVSIGDFVFIDENLDGVQDAEDTPLADIAVTLIDAEGNERYTTTNADGYYYFDNLQPGEPYTLVFEKPDGFEWTTQNAGDDDSIDSDVDPAGIVEFTSPPYGANLTGPDQTDNPTLDAGVIRLVSIGDYVWFDYDRDGVQGSHELEEPVAGVTVTLYDANGNQVGAPTVTDENGFYGFNYLLPDTDYYLIFDQPDNFDGWTLQNQGEEDAGDSDVDPATGRVDFTSPATGSNSLTEPDDPTLDAGLVVSYVSVGDYVWYDTNLDGVQDEDEAPAAGITVTLYDADGNVVGTTVTDENGYYWFNDLTPLADYTLEFEAPEAYTWTLQDQGEDDGADSDVDRVTGRVSFTADEFGYNLPFADDNGALITDNPSLDAGLVQLVSIGDYVWFDYDRDGVQGTHELEEPVAGVTVTLFDAEGTVIGTTTTDANGFYSFNNLYPGTEYSLEFEQPERFDGWTLQNADEDDAVDSDVDVDGRVIFTSPVSGENSLETPDDPTLDAGLIITRVSVGDYVWWDENRNGVQDPGEPGVPDVVVIIYGPDGEEVDRTTTDPNGYYAFEDLIPETEYTIVFEKPDGYAGWTEQGDLENDPGNPGDSNVDPSGNATVVTPEFGNNQTGPNEADDPTIDAGLIRLISVGDYVWYDYNRDGIQDADETPIEGVVVTITGPDGFTATTTTDPDGHYEFLNLIPETEYTITFEKPEGYTEWTVQGAGDDDAVDSNVDPSGTYTFITPRHGNNEGGADNTDDPTIDAGLVIKVSVGDYVWDDEDRNGIQDPGEPGVPGVVVIIYGPDGEEVDRTTTDPNGYYNFKDLYPDTEYEIEFQKPDGYSGWTTPGEGDDPGADSDVNPNGRVRFTTPSTGNNGTGPNEADNPTIDAGLVRLISVGDYVWYDVDRDGTQGENEPPVAGVVVTITGPNGFTATTTTDENGYYNFQDLLPETEYTITFEKPDGYTEWTITGAGENDAIDSNVDASGTYTFTTPRHGNNLIGPDQADDPTIDAGLVIKVSVGDYVWYDTNKNGIQDPEENPAPGIVVHLYEGERIVGTTTTDENGFYYFQDLFPNTEYYLVFEKPEGYDWTIQGAGNDEARDSNTDIFGIVRFTTPGTGTNLVGPDMTDLPTLDAGLVEVDEDDPATPAPDKKPEPIKELPSTGAGSETDGLAMVFASMAAMMLAAVALRLNAFKRS